MLEIDEGSGYAMVVTELAPQVDPLGHALLIAWLAATPAIIYGYAAIWAFLSVPGRFDVTVLGSWGMENALIAVLVAILLGTGLGYANACLVNWLTRERGVAAGFVH